MVENKIDKYNENENNLNNNLNWFKLSKNEIDEQYSKIFKPYNTSKHLYLTRENKKKLNAITAVKKISEKKIISLIVYEKIMSLDIIKYVEELSKEKITNEKTYHSNNVSADITDECQRRLTILDAVTEDSFKEIVAPMVNEEINGVDIVELVKNEFS